MRAKKLQLPVEHDVENKLTELKKFSVSKKIDLEEIAFVGNDINDAECMKKVGFPIAVADAVDEIKFEQIKVIPSNSDNGFTVVKLIDQIPQGMKVVTDGAYYVFAQSKAGELSHEH